MSQGVASHIVGSYAFLRGRVSMTKIRRKPLPTPFDADAAVQHSYRVWSNQGRIRLEQITLLNPPMVRSLITLWQEASGQPIEIPTGQIADIGFWRLIKQHDGSGILEVRDSPW